MRFTTTLTKVLVGASIAASSLLAASAASATPVTGPPTAVQALGGLRSIVVSWAAPASGPTPTSYSVSFAPSSGGTPEVTDPATSPLTISSYNSAALANGTSYSATVCANYVPTDPVGAQSANNGATQVCAEIVGATTYSLPDPPTQVTAVPGDRQATVNFMLSPISRPGARGGRGTATITYTATSAPGSKTCTVQLAVAQPVRRGSVVAPSCVVQGLTNGVPYTFTATATDEVGTSNASPASSPVIPFGRPLAPSTVRTVGGDHQVLIAWNPASGNGRYVFGYKVTASPGTGTCSTGSTPNAFPRTRAAAPSLQCTIKGLTNGQHYHFRVVAMTIWGASTPSASVEGTPEAPATAITAVVSPFASGSSAITSAMARQLAAIAVAIKKQGLSTVDLTGYADANGSTSGNLAISLARAEAVKSFLLDRLGKLGDGKVSITAVGKGATDFVGGDPNAAADRRVELFAH